MSDQGQPITEPVNHRLSKKKMKLLILITTVFCLFGSIGFLLVAFWGRFVKSTNDAYVQGNQVTLTPQVSGIVTSVNVDETQMVMEKQVLVCLDETDYRITLEAAQSRLGQVIRDVTEMFENVYALAAQFELRQAELFKAEVDYNDRRQVVSEGAVSDEELIHAEANYYAAKANVKSIKYQLMQAISAVQNTTISTHPLVETAKEDLRQAWVNLQRCTLRAPVTGIIAQKAVQVGESVNQLSPLLAIIPLDQLWINANFKETQLSKIRIGQPVTMTADMYGREVIYTGQVIGISSGSGAVFSPLPPQNATGNWIKIVQRIPVRIAINSDQLRRYPLWLGLSMNVKVDVRDTQGVRVPPPAVEKGLYVTDIFKTQIDGAEEIIEQILQKNITFDLSISHDVLSLVGK